VSTDRDAWTAYAARHGLIRSDQEPVVLERAGGNKYHADAIYVDGVRFASKAEAGRFLELRLEQRAGHIAELITQPVFPLHVMELWRSGLPIRITTVGKYTADFQYCDLRTGEIVVEDVKAEITKTEAYRLRKRIAECVHGITITERVY
jgi:Protein of unknown function (DUF1064)